MLQISLHLKIQHINVSLHNCPFHIKSFFMLVSLFCWKVSLFDFEFLFLMQLLKETPPDGDKFAKAVEVLQKSVPSSVENLWIVSTKITPPKKNHKKML